ncbi:aldehyde dehydrogenase family protein [Marivita sp. GX14005]|uniref:aldehyde dehydrogenase family protein n=1 Tax=Marivita sp. GX14005 TaxID=2942276 RepID=UPI00201A0564|nr:aldehyde dehydrogenase family protein [Marivita sp. GX14005]MCL3881893.1 aldehyde dehydrogenase family protein [Marivita sp. GX14005]
MKEPDEPSPHEIRNRFERQRDQAAKRRVTFGYRERRRALRDLSDAIRQNEAAIIAALTEDFGKPETETILTEILPLQQEIRHTLKHLKRWMRPSWRSPSLATFGTSAQVRREPRGVCLIIAPWNYPLILALGPLVSCLAAGNSAIVKPSEMTPATSSLIALLISQTFPPELVTVVEGGVDASTALLELPFDHIFFTGSPEVGRIVMQAAGKVLASVTLELGGKSPTIIGPHADLDRAAEWVTFGKFSNAGQICIAPDHLFVHRAIKAEFIAKLRARIAEAYGEGPASANLTRMVNARHADRVAGLIEDATDKGARILRDGGRDGNRIGPTLIEAVTPEMRVDNEEIFGPVLPILEYEHLSDVIDRINANPKPLALYIFDTDKRRIERIVQSTSSGGVGINLTVMQFTHPRLPFGGVNTSGIGAAHGEYGFRAFSHERAILRNRFSPLPILFPPYDGRKKRLVGLIRRFLG